MAKNKAINAEEMTSDGSRAINKFRLSDGIIMLVLTLLCLTCILPFIYLAAKSISSNNAVLAKQVYLTNFYNTKADLSPGCQGGDGSK